MKKLLKRLFAQCGFSLHRLPRGLVTGADLARDLRIVVGGRSRPCCIDAGANDGGTINLLRQCLVAPRIHAFEPNPATFAILQANHRATPDVKLNHAGLGDAPGTLTLQVFANHALNSFLPLTSHGRVRLDSNDAPQTVSVPVLRLDDYAAQEKLDDIDLLKVDTQGFELHVFRGAEAKFAARRIRAVLVELNFADLYVGQAAPAEVIAFLHARGLRLVDFYEKCRHNPVLGWCTALFARTDQPPAP